MTLAEQLQEEISLRYQKLSKLREQKVLVDNGISKNKDEIGKLESVLEIAKNLGVDKPKAPRSGPCLRRKETKTDSILKAIDDMGGSATTNELTEYFNGKYVSRRISACLCRLQAKGAVIKTNSVWGSKSTNSLKIGAADDTERKNKVISLLD